MFSHLFEKDIDGNYLIEEELTDEDSLKTIIFYTTDYQLLFNFCLEKNDFSFMKYANPKVLMGKHDENQYVLQYLLNEKNIIPEVLKFEDLFYLCPDKQFIKFLIKIGLYDFLANTINEDVLCYEIEAGKSVLDILLEKGYSFENKIFLSKKSIAILCKNDKLELAFPDVSLLTRPVSEFINDETRSETLLEYMLSRGYQPIKPGFRLNEKIIEILYKLQRADILASCVGRDFELLLNKSIDGVTYFDYVLESIKQRKIKSEIKKMSYWSVELLANYYLTIAKHDMLEFVEEITAKELLTKNNRKTLLDELLELDSDLTLNKIIPENVKSNIWVAAVLKSKGIKQDKIDLPLNEMRFNDHLNNFEKGLGIGPIHNEGDLLLKRLEELFLTDGCSDERLIQALISGYRNALIENYEVNIKELKNLIKVKEENKENFYYIMDEEVDAYFIPKRFISCPNTTVSILLHETGHALHYYIAKNKIPKEYEAIKQKVRENPETLVKIAEYANKMETIKSEVTKLVDQKYDSFFKYYYNDNLKEEIKTFLSKSKQEKKEEFKSLGITDEVIDIILAETFTEDEFIAQQKKIFTKQNVENILRSEFSSYLAICDILDAIYDGEICSQVLKDNEGNVITGIVGHGLLYYYGTVYGFDEMVAEFSEINKSKNSKKMLEMLRSIVGDELYNMLSEFYYNNIICGKINQMEENQIIEVNNSGKHL